MLLVLVQKCFCQIKKNAFNLHISEQLTKAKKKKKTSTNNIVNVQEIDDI